MLVIHRIISRLYELPIYCWLIIAVALIIIWTLLTYTLRKGVIWKKLNILAFVISVILIIMVTLVYRQSEEKGISLVPFSSFVLAKTHSDIYHELMMNVILFLPIGLTVPYIFCDKAKHPVILTIGTAIVFSVIIELLQLVFMRGYAEIDDVIFNTLGAFLGCLSYIIYSIIEKKRTYS